MSHRFRQFGNGKRMAEGVHLLGRVHTCTDTDLSHGLVTAKGKRTGLVLLHDCTHAVRMMSHTGSDRCVIAEGS